MIAFIRGSVKGVEEDSLIIDVGGIGYQVYTPLAQMDAVPVIGEEIELHTVLVVKEELLQLFGFTDREQLTMFRLLTGVSGVGAKIALTALNALSPALIVQGILTENENTFRTVPGIGKKLGQRLILELKDKCAKMGYNITGVAKETPPESVTVLPGQEVVTALTQLGYGAMEARSLAVRAAKNLGGGASLEALIMEALKLAAR